MFASMRWAWRRPFALNATLPPEQLDVIGEEPEAFRESVKYFD